MTTRAMSVVATMATAMTWTMAAEGCRSKCRKGGNGGKGGKSMGGKGVEGGQGKVTHNE
jgi:hypothetical protein